MLDALQLRKFLQQSSMSFQRFTRQKFIESFITLFANNYWGSKPKAELNLYDQVTNLISLFFLSRLLNPESFNILRTFRRRQRAVCTTESREVIISRRQKLLSVICELLPRKIHSRTQVLIKKLLFDKNQNNCDSQVASKLLSADYQDHKILFCQSTGFKVKENNNIDSASTLIPEQSDEK